MKRRLIDLVIDLRDILVAPVRFGQFLGVGAIGAVVDLSVSSALTLGAVLPAEWAKLVGAELAIVLMFLINDRWTFADHGAAGLVPKLRRLLKSNVVRSAGLFIQFIVVYVLTRLDVTVVVADTDVWPLITLPVAIGCAVAVNYVAESLLTWRVHDSR
jgi:putative flippase GtrA